MPFVEDQELAEEAGRVFGEYITTFKSRTGQVRADLFRVGNIVNAHVSFPTGLDATSVTDPYLTELRTYTEQQGVAAGQLRLVYS